MIEVVNMRTCYPPWGQRGDIRIDRATKWGSPFHITEEMPRSKVLEEYRKYLEGCLADGLLDLSELRDAKRLGCWCKPLPCHGDILKREIEKRYGNDSTQVTL